MTKVLLLTLAIMQLTQAVPVPVPDWYGYNKTLYAFFSVPHKWVEAKAHCESLGGTLASVHSLQEADYIHQLTGGDSTDPYYIGGRKEGGSWEWTDGSTFDFTHWLPGEPNNLGGAEKCLSVGHPTIGNGSQWNDRNCGNGAAVPFVCQKPLTCA